MQSDRLQRACQEIGIDPPTRVYTGASDMASLVAFVVSLNLQRRHLTSSQKAVLALDIEKMLAEEARKRQVALAGTRPNSQVESDTLLKDFSKVENGNNGAANSECHANEATAQAAAIVGTNRQYVSARSLYFSQQTRCAPFCRSQRPAYRSGASRATLRLLWRARHS